MAAPVFATGDVPTADQVNEWFVNTRFVRKASTQTVSSTTTLVNDNTLFVGVLSNAVYEVRLRMLIASQTTTDFKFGFTAPSGSTFDYFVNATDINGGAYSGDTSYIWSIGTPSGIGGLGGNTVPGMVDGFLVTGGTSGTLQLQWAQNTSGASGTSLLAGSAMLVRRVS